MRAARTITSSCTLHYCTALTLHCTGTALHCTDSHVSVYNKCTEEDRQHSPCHANGRRRERPDRCAFRQSLRALAPTFPSGR
jgi:hypothetical protein